MECMVLSNVLSALRVIAKEENEINGCAYFAGYTDNNLCVIMT